MIGIIEYGMGNLRSVQKALELVGAQAVILRSPTDGCGVGRLAKLVLPGVGAFADGMEHLQQRGWVDAIREFVASGKPFLGICLGMQLLFEGSEEDAPSAGRLVPGLALLPGPVVQFRPEARAVAAGQRLKVPHMGWNALTWRREDPLLRGLSEGAAVYFVHSYFPQPVETSERPVTSATCDYGGRFTASVWRDNLWATQFHPEKSQRVGLRMLANFAGL